MPTDSFQSIFALALFHQTANRLHEAVSLYRQLLATNPSHADAWNNLGVALKMLGDLDGAIEAFQNAIALLPGRAETHAYLGHALRDAGQLDDAIASYRRGLSIAPDPRTASSLLLALHAHPAYGRAELLREHQRWNEVYAQPLAAIPLHHSDPRAAPDRLRIGYVAADLGNHPLGRFLLPLVENHDHLRFEIFCYNDHARPDDISASLRAGADVWRETGSLSDAELARLIAADRIDILVDLTMHAPGNRLLAFAQKPAPIQVTYLAYASTTGLSTIDYRLTDPHLDPPGIDESLYSERSLRLPHSYWCYPAPPEAPPVSPTPPAAAAGYLAFACLNSFGKTSPQMMGLWARVLASLPGSRLLLHAQEGGHRAAAKNLFAQHGIDPARIEFVGFLPLPDYFAQYARIDIALDTYPWAGGATTCDALWMGVPVVSLAGETAVSRGGFSILTNLHLPDLAAHNPDQFVRIATTLSLTRLHELRATLRQRMLASPLMNAPAFARDVESAFQTMRSARRPDPAGQSHVSCGTAALGCVPPPGGSRAK